MCEGVNWAVFRRSGCNSDGAAVFDSSTGTIGGGRSCVVFEEEEKEGWK